MRNPYTPGSAAAFFWEHAGTSYNPQTETPEQGRACGALQLKEAEEQARKAGASFTWEQDPDVTSADWVESGKDGSRGRKPWGTWLCMLRGPSGEVLGSLGGIDFGRDGEPWGDPYRRVVEAELAHEHADDILADALTE